jgi:hypothetical protein
MQNNTAELRTLLQQVQELPEAITGVMLPTLSNPGTASDLASGKELIDQNGNIVTGTHQCQAGGVEVKKNTGSVSVGSSSKSVSLGYKPDVVSITVSGYPALTAVFGSSTSIDVWTGNDSQSTYPFLCVKIAQTSTGFTVSGAYRINWELDDATYSGTGNYTAIKYTE